MKLYIWKISSWDAALMSVQACVNILLFHAVCLLFACAVTFCVLQSVSLTITPLSCFPKCHSENTDSSLVVNIQNTTAKCVITAWMLWYSASQLVFEGNFSLAWLQMVVISTMLIWKMMLLCTALQDLYLKERLPTGGAIKNYINNYLYVLHYMPLSSSLH